MADTTDPSDVKGPATGPSSKPASSQPLPPNAPQTPAAPGSNPTRSGTSPATAKKNIAAVQGDTKADADKPPMSDREKEIRKDLEGKDLKPAQGGVGMYTEDELRDQEVQRRMSAANPAPPGSLAANAPVDARGSSRPAGVIHYRLRPGDACPACGAAIESDMSPALSDEDKKKAETDKDFAAESAVAWHYARHHAAAQIPQFRKE